MRLFVDQTLVSYQDIRKQLPTHFAVMLSFFFCVDNGLFCVCDLTKSSITFCNPATGEFRILPECNQNIPRKSNSVLQNLGFRLDPFSNDYKVVYIQTYYDKEKDSQELEHYAIYKMGINSWKVLNHEDFQLPEYLSCSVCVNSICYWHASSKILAFNLGNEAFQLIESPFPISYGRLLPLHDHITICDTDMFRGTKKSYDIWVLNDEGKWTKLLNIEPILGVASKFGFWKNGKVFIESITGKLLLYDLETRDFYELEIKPRAFRNLLYVYTYEESLVAVKRY